MTGPEHFTEAGKLLAAASKRIIGSDHEWLHPPARRAELRAEAQVHATLALAAATALAGYIPESGMPEADKRAWYTTASEGPGEKQRVREARAAEAAEFAQDGAQ